MGAVTPSISVAPATERRRLGDPARVARRLRGAAGDPTTLVGDDHLWRASWTPAGPATVHVRWTTDGVVDAAAWGPGGDWLLAHVPGMLGLDDEPVSVHGHHPVVDAAERDHPGLRLGRTGTLYHDLLPAVLGQRITGPEAGRQWRRLCGELGEAAPGPHPRLRTPPPPASLHRRPAWWFHRLGIEASRARTLTEVARHADRLHALGGAEGDPDVTAGVVARGRAVRSVLVLLPGIGPWTAAVATASALGDPDALAVGDYHLKNVVSWALAGRARGTDDEMLALLEPYAGQRHRVTELLAAAGWQAPQRGPRQRVLPMHRW